VTPDSAASDIPKPPVDLPVLGTFAGYDVLGRLALGGMAEILLTRHANTEGDHRFMVVKRILPHFDSSIRTSASSISSVRTKGRTSS